MEKIFFTPGPSQLHPDYISFFNEAMKKNVGSLYHRSKEFAEIYKTTENNLRQLMQIPASHHIFFLSSASEIWERILLNTVDKNSFHMVNGAFGKKFYDYAISLKKNATKIEFEKDFEIENIKIPVDTELICITENETSTGMQFQESFFESIKLKNNSALICADVVSSAPFSNLNFSIVDMAFFSVQKCFGMPPGLGVLIINDKALEKNKLLISQQKNISAHHTFENLLLHSKKFSTPSTPNTLAIFILGKIAENFISRKENLKQELEEKINFLYDELSTISFLKPSLENINFRSKTIAVFDCEFDSNLLINFLDQKGFVIGNGYGENKNKQLRIANFPTTTKQQIECLIKAIRLFKN